MPGTTLVNLFFGTARRVNASNNLLVGASYTPTAVLWQFLRASIRTPLLKAIAQTVSISVRGIFDTLSASEHNHRQAYTFPLEISRCSAIRNRHSVSTGALRKLVRPRTAASAC